MFYSDVSAVVHMYSIKERLDQEKYPELSKWMSEMGKNQFILDNVHKMKEVISARRMYGDFLKAWIENISLTRFLQKILRLNKFI